MKKYKSNNRYSQCPEPPSCCESGQYALDECGCCLKCAKVNLYCHLYCHQYTCTLKHSIIRCKIVTGVNHHQYTIVPERTFFNFQRSFPAIFQFCKLAVELPPSIYLCYHQYITDISLHRPSCKLVVELPRSREGAQEVSSVSRLAVSI